MAVVLVTGCSSGIGRATALQLARSGHHVCATMRSPERGGAPLTEAAASEGLSLDVDGLDVDDDASVEAAVARAAGRAGPLDVLVNNAGIDFIGSIEGTSLERAKQIFETNVFGVLRMIRAVLPGMRERGRGTIVNVGSVAGHVALACQGHYAATKYALEALSESLASEVRRFGIRVALIEPGAIATPILDKLAGEVDAATGSPYADIERRTAAFFGDAAGWAEGPEGTARIIEEAITTDTPRLRWVTGATGPVFLEGRRRVSDEEWIALGGTAGDTDAEWFGRLARTFPMPD